MTDLLPVPASPAEVGVEDVDARVVALVDQARAWLTEAVDLSAVKEVRARATGLASYLRAQVTGSAQAVIRATELRLRAERRLGELLAEQAKDPGGRPAKTGNDAVPVIGPPTLGEQGITKNESSTYQRLAALDEETFETAIEAGREAGKVSRAQVLAAGGLTDPGDDLVDRIDTRRRIEALIERARTLGQQASDLSPEVEVLLDDLPDDLVALMVDGWTRALEEASDRLHELGVAIRNRPQHLRSV